MDNSTVNMESKGTPHDEKTSSAAQSLFRQFTESTTLHGIYHVFSNSSKIRRFIWLLCLLGSTAIFIVAIQNLVSSYLSFDVVTRVTLINQEYAIFPAITICNFNPMRKDYLKRMNMSEVFAVVLNEEDKKALRWEKSFNTSMENVLRNGGHKMDKENMLYSCVFQGRQCGEEHFKPVFTRMGLCYTFNEDSQNSSFARVQNPGEDFGFKVELSAQQDQYYGQQSLAGFKVHVHSQNEPPLVKENGFAVMPGTCTFVAVTRTQVVSLPAPYKTKCENKKLSGTTLYSKPLCYEACRISFIIKHCGCRDAEMPKIPGIPPCTFQQKGGCVLPKFVEFTKSSTKNCSCPKPCDVTSYETRLSYAQYPSEHIKETLAGHIAKTIYGQNVSSDMRDAAYEYIGKNIVQIRIFFHDLNYHVIEDVPKYQLASLFAEAGGMLGLLLGASVITVLEFLEFLFSLFVIKCLK